MQQQHTFGVRLTPFLAILATLGQIGDMRTVQAQSVEALRAAPSANSTSLAASKSKPLDLVIDTDAGVDDAAAILWLLSQKNYPVDILGVGTVAGNTTVKNAANNVLTILDNLAQQDIPVAIGAAAPLLEPLSRTGSLIHGPDGLWGAQKLHDLSGLSHDVPSFYRDLAQAHPGATLLSLGPLTNLAETWEQYPDALKSFKRIIALGGAKNGGNRTPVAEFNIWQDPQAANELLSARLPITLVPLDAFQKFTLTPSAVQAFQTQDSKAAKLIAQPLQLYTTAQTPSADKTNVSIGDVAAAIYAVDSSLGTAQSALVKVLTQPSLARGETIIGLTETERLFIIASDAELSRLANQKFTDPTFNLQTALGAILAREPNNARLVTNIKAQQMRELFLSTLAPNQKTIGVSDVALVESPDQTIVLNPSQETIDVPEPSCVLGLLAFSALSGASLLKRHSKLMSTEHDRR